MAEPGKSSELPSKPPLWNDPKARALVFQILVSLVVAFTLYYLVRNTLHNMESRGISTGFGFLSSEAGFGITQTLIPYDESSSYGRTFLVGLLNTVLVSVLGIFCATILGFLMGIARLSSNWLVNKVATAYIEIFRNIPLLLQIFFWYFAVFVHLPRPKQSMDIGGIFFLNNRGLYLPRPVAAEGFWLTTTAFVVAIVAVVFLVRWSRLRQEKTGEQFPAFLTSLGILIGLPAIVFVLSGAPLTWDVPGLSGFNFKGGMSMIPELAALLFALTVYTGTFIAETVRAGIQSVSHGQTEAARALGLRNSATLRLITIPQAMRVIIPPLTSQYLNLTKNSSLAAAIGYPDLVAVFAGTTLNQTGQAVEVIAMTMMVYLTLSLSISLLMNWYNAKMALRER
jgi:general L-amino acid transport system permease protein